MGEGLADMVSPHTVTISSGEEEYY